MKLLEEKTHLDPIYISFQADQHNKMNSVLQYSLFREKKSNERTTRLLLLLHSTIFFYFFFPLHSMLLLKQESYFKYHSTSWRRERASGGIINLPTQTHALESQSCLFHTICIQLNEFNVATTFHMRNDIFIYILQEGPSLDTGSWLTELILRVSK